MYVRIVCAVLLSVLLCTNALAVDLTPEDRQEALRLIEAMGGKDLILQYVRRNMNVVKKFRPDIPADKMPLVEREIATCVTEKIVAPGGLAEQLAPVFAKHFSPKELHDLVAFYESPLGKKAVAVLPSTMREAKDVAQRMAIGMIPELNQRVTDVLKRDAKQQAEISGGAQQ
jgi:uncharacterized protein